MPSNPYEERARAVKAAKLARVAGRVLAKLDADYTAEERALAREQLAGAPPDFRSRVARLAETTPPSDRTWEIVCAIVLAEAS